MDYIRFIGENFQIGLDDAGDYDGNAAAKRKGTATMMFEAGQIRANQFVFKPITSLELKFSCSALEQRC